MIAVMIILVSLYIVCTLVLGIKAHRCSTNTSEDYFVAKRSLSWGHLGLTFFATWFSTFAFLGSPGFFYKKGVTWLFTQGIFCLLAPFLAWYMGRKIWLLGREKGYITPGDLLADFYQSKTVRLITALISILALIPYCLIQLVGIGKVFAASTDGSVPYWAGVAAAVFATAFYTFIGGIRAIVWTDALQGVLFLFILILGAGVTIYAAGGIIDGYSAAISLKPEAFVFQQETIGSPLTMILIWSFGFIVLPHMWQRNYMARSARAFSRSIVVVSVLSYILILASMLIGTLAIAFMPEVADSDKLVPLIFARYLPWASPLLVLATFAAGMSTIDSQLLTVSSVVVRDVSQSLFHSRLSPQREKSLGRIVVLIMILFLGLLAVLPRSQGSIIVLASKGTAIAFLLLVPLCGPLFWRQASKGGAISSLLTGASLLLILETGIIQMKLPFAFGSPAVCVLAQTVIFIIGSFLFPRKTSAKIIDYPEEIIQKAQTG